MKEEINRTSLGKDVERFYISVLWPLSSLRWALPAWGAVWQVGHEMLGSSGVWALPSAPRVVLWLEPASFAGVSRGCPVTVCPAGPCAQTASTARGPGGPVLPQLGWGPATLSANQALLLLLGLIAPLRWTGLDHLPRAALTPTRSLLLV